MEDISNGVELQICELRAFNRAEATATVRNLRGPVFRSARFCRVSDSPDPIDLELTEISWYGRAVDEIPTGHTALVTPRGAAASILRSGNLSDGWQCIEGCNT
ncbi:hypothetical protein [Dactylosporangium sp. NPDC050588]|uniref:hypothetical protein n=1 Tax=Dactylosporangium sp. NPDC050588 TaxID=3157211 RepID=UPI0033F8278C